MSSNKLKSLLTQNKESISPELARLFSATLMRAVLDVKGDGSVTQNERANALAFFNQKPKEKLTPFSFHWLCEALDLCPKRFLDSMLNIPSKDIKRFYYSIKGIRTFSQALHKKNSKHLPISRVKVFR